MPKRGRMRTDTKEKVGTILDSGVVQKLKERSAKEGRAISEVIQDAIVRYTESEALTRDMRLAAVHQFCSRPFNLTHEELEEILKEDYFEQ